MGENPYKVEFVVPTVFGPEDLTALRAAQLRSVGDMGRVNYLGEVVGRDWPRHVYDKLVAGYRAALKEDPGFVVLMHHDTMIEDPGAFWSLLVYMKNEGIGVAGAPECDGIRRFNENGKAYLSSCFMVINPAAVPRWYARRSMDGLLLWEDYWIICKVARENGYDVFGLDAVWRQPRIGGAVTYSFRGRPVATHLWNSTHEGRENVGFVEGRPIQDHMTWRKEFADAYLGEADDRVRGVADDGGRPEGYAGEADGRAVPALSAGGDGSGSGCG